MKIRINSNRAKHALSRWSDFKELRRVRSLRSTTFKFFISWKSRSRHIVTLRQAMILRLREVLKCNYLAYCMKGFCLNLTMKRVSMIVDLYASRTHLSFWRLRTLRRRKIRRMLDLLLDGHHHQVLRLYFRYLKVLFGPARISEKIFLQETIFRRWRCYFVAVRYYRMGLFAQTLEAWRGLVFGRLAARFNVRRGRRIASRLLTRIRQQRCSNMRVFFNRWAVQANVPLPGIRIKNISNVAQISKKQFPASLASVNKFTILSDQGLVDNGTSKKKDIFSHESLDTWKANIVSARNSKFPVNWKHASLQDSFSVKELSATTIR